MTQEVKKISIRDIIDTLGFEANSNELSKHIASLYVQSPQEMMSIINLLKDYNINLKMIDLPVLANDIEFVKSQIEKMKSINELPAYQEKAIRINVQDADKRIIYLRSIDEPYKNPEGKYANIIFTKCQFENKYGTEYLKGDLVTTQEPKEEAKPFIQEDKSYEAIDLVNDAVDPIEEILNKTAGNFDDKSFERYLKLSDNIREVTMQVSNSTEVAEEVFENVQKLVTSDINNELDNKTIIFVALTHGRNLSPALLQGIESSIDEIVNIGRNV